MSTLLVRHARVVVTMDDARREVADGGVFARDGVVEAVGPSADLPATADVVVDARDHVVLPGLVNTHHHAYQTLTRAVAATQDAEPFGWLKTLSPIRALRDADVPVGRAVDGSASNDSGHLLGEARLALLPQRVAHGPVDGAQAMMAREVLEIATRGGARVLGRDDVGVPLDDVGVAGALHDPVAALRFCHVPKVGFSVVRGRVVVRDGELVTVDLPRLLERHHRLARELVQG